MSLNPEARCAMDGLTLSQHTPQPDPDWPPHGPRITTRTPPTEAEPDGPALCRFCRLPIYPSWHAQVWLHRLGSLQCAEAAEDEAVLGEDT